MFEATLAHYSLGTSAEGYVMLVRAESEEMDWAFAVHQLL
jgi:hypothetical protein